MQRLEPRLQHLLSLLALCLALPLLVPSRAKSLEQRGRTHCRQCAVLQHQPLQLLEVAQEACEQQRPVAADQPSPEVQLHQAVRPQPGQIQTIVALQHGRLLNRLGPAADIGPGQRPLRQARIAISASDLLVLLAGRQRKLLRGTSVRQPILAALVAAIILRLPAAAVGARRRLQLPPLRVEQDRMPRCNHGRVDGQRQRRQATVLAQRRP